MSPARLSQGGTVWAARLSIPSSSTAVSGYIQSCFPPHSHLTSTMGEEACGNRSFSSRSRYFRTVVSYGIRLTAVVVAFILSPIVFLYTRWFVLAKEVTSFPWFCMYNSKHFTTLAEYLCFWLFAACFDAYKHYLGLCWTLLHRITFSSYFLVAQRAFSSLLFPFLLSRDTGVCFLLYFPVLKYSVLPITFWSHLLSQFFWVETITSRTPSKAEKFCRLQDPFFSHVSFCMQSIHTRLGSE